MKLMLDSHVPPAVARGLRAQIAIEVVALRDWQGGDYLDVEDSQILLAAQRAGWTFVTYDQKTIAPLTKEWAEADVPHGGIIFVDNRTIAPRNLGGLIRALIRLIKDLGDVDWENRIAYLRP